MVFLKTNGSGDGSSWNRAIGNLTEASADPANKGRQIWVDGDASKVYPKLNLTQDITILTGFNSANMPVDSDSRSKWNNKIQSITMDVSLTAHIAGFIFTGEPENPELAKLYVGNATLEDCKFEPTGLQYAPSHAVAMGNHSNVRLKNIWVSGHTFQSNVIYTYDADELIIEGGIVSSNTSWNPAIDIVSDAQATFTGGANVSNNLTQNPDVTGYQVRVMDAGSLVLKGSVTLKRNDIYGPYSEVP